ncbi:hypothetical protein T492DRAFT_1107780 [Pavlovales sp. CCMP2436]|nr:hypothetical protein T492DRAFT_1107780 [Pavlovales sp. CCMP2436]
MTGPWEQQLAANRTYAEEGEGEEYDYDEEGEEDYDEGSYSELTDDTGWEGHAPQHQLPPPGQPPPPTPAAQHDSSIDELLREISQNRPQSRAKACKPDSHLNCLPAGRVLRRAKPPSHGEAQPRPAQAFIAVSAASGTSVATQARERPGGGAAPTRRMDSPGSLSPLLWLARQGAAVGGSGAASPLQASQSMPGLARSPLRSGKLPTRALVFGRTDLVGALDVVYAPPPSHTVHPVVMRVLERHASAPHVPERGGSGREAAALRPLVGAPLRVPVGRSILAAQRRPRFVPAEYGAFRASRDAERGKARRLLATASLAEQLDEDDEFLYARPDSERRPPRRLAGQFVQAHERGPRCAAAAERAAAAAERAAAAAERAAATSASAGSLAASAVSDDEERRTVRFKLEGPAGQPERSCSLAGEMPPPIAPTPFVPHVFNTRWVWEQRHAVARVQTRAEAAGEQLVGEVVTMRDGLHLAEGSHLPFELVAREPGAAAVERTSQPAAARARSPTATANPGQQQQWPRPGPVVRPVAAAVMSRTTAAHHSGATNRTAAPHLPELFGSPALYDLKRRQHAGSHDAATASLRAAAAARA